MASPKSVLVHLDGGPRGAETLRMAARIAMRFDARLTAVFAAEGPPLRASATDPAAAAALEYQIEAELAMQADAQGQVAVAEEECGLDIVWRATTRNAIRNVALHARHADLLVMSQTNPGLLPGIGLSLPAGVILAAGRPVLMVPYAGTFHGRGDSVLIAWNAGREAARAAADAMPFLRAAREVNVVSLSPADEGDGDDVAGADIGLWLARHDIRVTVHERSGRDPDVGPQLLAMTADLGADMLVMGAYGHSRTHEMVLGGATRTVLGNMTVPTLMSH